MIVVPAPLTQAPVRARASAAWRQAPPRELLAATVAGLGSAVPPGRSQADLWESFFAEHYGHWDLARRLWHGCGIDTRHGVADPCEVDVREWGTERRMRRFNEQGLPLAREAAQGCLADAGLAPADVGLLTVVSCTGYATPGLDVMLAGELGLDAGVQRLHIGHMGCYAAVPALATVADAATARGKAALMLCIELPSLHIQAPSEDIEQLVAHALFADAATAAAVVPGGAGFEVRDVVARTDIEHAAMMTWDVTDHGFRMGLSPQVPQVLERHVAGVVSELLAGHGLAVEDVAAWAVHPGGPAILEVIAERVGLEQAALAESRSVLRDFGNCSSATVMLVLDRIRRERDLLDGDPVVLMAFGPGLTLYAALLRHRR